MAEYLVDLGRFRVTVNLLNLQSDSPPLNHKMGGGSYGTVTAKRVAGSEFVAKVMKRERKTDKEMEGFVCEVAVSKLCAMFEIGPDVETSIPFDLVVYEDAVQFHLEKCETIFQCRSLSTDIIDKPECFQRDLKKCLNVLHSLHIVHKDIKPDNMLYCLRLNQYVLCDFGCSEYVQEDIGGVSRTICAGTYEYMGTEMLELRGNKNKRVDLYYNDVAGCEIMMMMLRCEREDKYRSAELKKLKSLSKQSSSEHPSLWDQRQSEQAPSYYHSTSERPIRSNSEQRQIVRASQSLNSSSGEVEQSATKQPIQQLIINPAFKQPDSYQFYRLVYAATAFNEHKFNLKENLHILTEEQQAYIHGILLKSLNREKIDSVLKELRAIQPNEGTFEKRWEEDFSKVYINNFLQHRPRLAEVPVVSQEWVRNLMRLIGKTKELQNLMKVVSSKLQPGMSCPKQIRKQTHEIIVDLIARKRYSKLLSYQDKIMGYADDFLEHNGFEQNELKAACTWIFYSILSYDTKELFLHHLIQALRQPTKSNQSFLQCLTAILAKKEKAANLLQYTSTRICVCLVYLHYSISKENSCEMLKVCKELLRRLDQEQTKYCYMEILNIRRIQFFVKRSRMELDHRTVRLFFEASLKLFNSTSHESFSILKILKQRLRSFQQLRFPLGDVRLAQVELEKCRQFYCGMEDMDMDTSMMFTSRNEDTQNTYSVGNSDLDNRLLRLLQQGKFQLYIEIRKKMEIVIKRQGGQVVSLQREFAQILQEANMLCKIGETSEADMEHQPAKNIVFNESLEITPEQLRKYRTQLLAQQQCPEIRLDFLSERGDIAEYLVVAYKFRFVIRLLYMRDSLKSPERLPSRSQGNKFIAVVRQRTKKTEGLYYFIRRIAIIKLHALYKIGPDVDTSIPFDLIVFDKEVLFYSEECEKIYDKLSSFSQAMDAKRQLLKGLSDIKRCLKILHCLQIVHTDIKSPWQFLYCTRLEKYVLNNFDFPCFWQCVRKTANGYQQDMVDCRQVFKRLEKELEKKFRELQYKSIDSSERNEDKPPTISELELQYKNPACYAFYQTVHAATSINDHHFKLKENLTQLTEEQTQYVEDIIRKSLNKQKLEALLEELNSPWPEESKRQARWKKKISTAYSENFCQGKPRYAELPDVNQELLDNLEMLLKWGAFFEVQISFEKIRQIIQLDRLLGKGKDYSHSKPPEKYQLLVAEVYQKRYENLFAFLDLILYSNTDGNQKRKLREISKGIVPGLFSSKAKQWLLKVVRVMHENDPRQLLFEARSEHILHLMTDIINKKMKAVKLIQSIDQHPKEPPEHYIFLLILHYQLSQQNSGDMLKVCRMLLNKLLSRQYERRYSIEILCLQHIQFLIKGSLGDFDQKSVRLHFEECMKLLSLQTSHENSCILLRILNERLYYYQRLSFPLSEISIAHIELEQSRQFYSLMQNISIDLQFGNVSNDPNSAFNTIMAREQRVFFLEQQRQVFQRARQKKRRIQNAKGNIQEAERLMCGRQAIQSSRVMREVEPMLYSFLSAACERGYFKAKAQLNLITGDHQQAYDSCIIAIKINNRHDDIQHKRDYAYGLDLLLSNIYCQLGKCEESLLILSQLPKQQINYAMQVKLHESYAQTYRVMDRLEESMEFCNKVFELEKKGFIPPHESTLAHSIMALIYEELEQQDEQMEHAWMALEKTKTLGDETSCVMFSLILQAEIPRVGDEAFNLISYARESTDPIRECMREEYIADDLYCYPVPFGQLPLSMPTSEFVRIAEDSLRELPMQHQEPCFLFKKKLLKVMESRMKDEPKYKLLYIRTLLEAYLHRFIAGPTKELVKELREVIEQMSNFQVNPNDKQSREKLVEFAVGLLLRSIEKIEESSSV